MTNKQPQYLYLTTTGRRSGKAREIEIWFTEHAGRYYVIAEYAMANWVENIRSNASVRVRVGKLTFAANGRVIDPAVEPELHARIQKLSEDKYGWSDGLVVELAPEKK
jgi:deazaflavin-dependent oxidoreductase (nitroreductase family)